MKNSKLFKSFFSLIASIVLFFAFSFNLALSQEIPNGDGDLLWERSIYPRFVNDAKFHPINGNIIAAVNHEIWEIDPKDGHTIRVFEGGVAGREIKDIVITSDGNTIISVIWSSTGVTVWDYLTGNISKVLPVNADYIELYPNDKYILIDYPMKKGLTIYDWQNEEIIKQVPVKYAIEKMSLSKDGKFVAFGRYVETSGSDYAKFMELWDAETLTKIKDFGSPGDIVEFRDVQISDDNQYVGFITGGNDKLYFFDITKNHKVVYDGALTLTFSNESNSFLIQQDTSWNKFITYIVDINNFKPIYEYKKFSAYNYIFNNNNELFGGREKLLFFSNNWKNVGVKEQSKDVLFISYSNSILSFQLLLNHTIVGIVVTDTLGKKYLEENITHIEGNEIRRNISLTSGTYFLTITTTTGHKISQKFIVAE